MYGINHTILNKEFTECVVDFGCAKFVSILPLTSKASKALRMVSSSSAPPAIFSAKSITICVKLTGPGASESMPWASPSETDLPTELKAATMSEEDKRPSLSASMIPKASLNSWICLWEKRAKTLEPLFLAFFDPEPLAIVFEVFKVCGLEEGGNRNESCQAGTQALVGLPC